MGKRSPRCSYKQFYNGKMTKGYFELRILSLKLLFTQNNARPFIELFNPRFQGESWYLSFHMRISFLTHTNYTYFLSTVVPHASLN